MVAVSSVLGGSAKSAVVFSTGIRSTDRIKTRLIVRVQAVDTHTRAALTEVLILSRVSWTIWRDARGSAFTTSAFTLSRTMRWVLAYCPTEEDSCAFGGAISLNAWIRTVDMAREATSLSSGNCGKSFGHLDKDFDNEAFGDGRDVVGC